MFNRDTWLEIANTVMSHPMRTFLTGLSIALGVFRAKVALVLALMFLGKLMRYLLIVWGWLLV